jgi:hypothetical protein
MCDESLTIRPLLTSNSLWVAVQLVSLTQSVYGMDGQGNEIRSLKTAIRGWDHAAIKDQTCCWVAIYALYAFWE